MIPVLLLANAVADGNTMDRYYLNTTEQQPKCIDGSPAIAYLAQNQSSKQFIFWLEGGGICKSLSDCQGRAQGSLGSSLGRYGSAAVLRMPCPHPSVWCVLKPVLNEFICPFPFPSPHHPPATGHI